MCTCHLTQCGLGQDVPPYQMASWSIQPFDDNRHGPKSGAANHNLPWLPVFIWTVKIWTVITNPNTNPNPNKNPNPNSCPNPVLTVQISTIQISPGNFTVQILTVQISSGYSFILPLFHSQFVANNKIRSHTVLAPASVWTMHRPCWPHRPYTVYMAVL